MPLQDAQVVEAYFKKNAVHDADGRRVGPGKDDGKFDAMLSKCRGGGVGGPGWWWRRWRGFCMCV